MGPLHAPKKAFLGRLGACGLPSRATKNLVGCVGIHTLRTIPAHAAMQTLKDGNGTLIATVASTRTRTSTAVQLYEVRTDTGVRIRWVLA
jgi:hypothetical protein